MTRTTRIGHFRSKTGPTGTVSVVLLRRSILLIVVKYLVPCSLLLSFDVPLRFIRFNDDSVHNGKVQSRRYPIVRNTNQQAISASSQISTASAAPSVPPFASMPNPPGMPPPPTGIGEENQRTRREMADYLKNNDLFKDPRVNEQIRKSSLVSKNYKSDTERVVDKFFRTLAVHGRCSLLLSVSKNPQNVDFVSQIYIFPLYS